MRYHDDEATFQPIRRNRTGESQNRRHEKARTQARKSQRARKAANRVH